MPRLATQQTNTIQQRPVASKNSQPVIKDLSNQIYNDSKSSEPEPKEEISMLTLRNPIQDNATPFARKQSETWKLGVQGSRKDSQVDNQGRANEPLIGIGKRDSKAFDDGGDLADLFGSDDGGEEEISGFVAGRDREPKDFLTRQKEKTEMEKKLMKERQHEEMARIVNQVTKKKMNEEVDLQSEPDKEEEEALNSDDDVTGIIFFFTIFLKEIK